MSHGTVNYNLKAYGYVIFIPWFSELNELNNRMRSVKTFNGLTWRVWHR